MKTEVKKIDSNKREIIVEITGDVVKNKFTEVFEKIGKEAKVPGFRSGHVPLDILEKNFSSQAHEQVLRELVPDIYNKAVDKEALDVIELPEISDVKLDRQNLSFKATVEVSPEIKLGPYKGIKVSYKKITVGADEVKRNLDTIKETRKLDAIDDGFAKSMGFPDVAELEAAVTRQLAAQKENHQRNQIEHELIETLLKDTTFKVPQSMAKRQLDDLVRQAKVDMALRGMPREQIDTQDKALAEKLLPQAERQVRVYLVLSEIAKAEKITVDDHMPQKVIEFLFKSADWKTE